MTEGRCDKIKQQQLNKNKGGAAVINRFKESKLFSGQLNYLSWPCYYLLLRKLISYLHRLGHSFQRCLPQS